MRTSKIRQVFFPTGVSSLAGAFLLTLMIGVCLFAATSPARADVASIMARLKTGAAEFSQLEGRKAELTRANEQEMKAYNALDTSHTQIRNELLAKAKAFGETQNKELEAANAIVEGWNRRCGSDYVGELPEAAYNKCASEKATLEPIVTAKRQRVEAETGRFEREVIKPGADIMTRQEKGMDEISARIKQRFNEWLGLDERAKTLKAQLEGYRTQLAAECHAATTPEALKHCHSIGWDNAAQTLPTIEEIVPHARNWPGG